MLLAARHALICQPAQGTLEDPVHPRLAGILEEFESRSLGASSSASPVVSTGWETMPTLATGAIHEWFSAAYGDGAGMRHGSPKDWLPPLGMLIHIAHRAMTAGSNQGRSRVLWIGRRLWPYPRSLINPLGTDRSLLERSVFVDPPSRDERVWAIDLALRCGAVAAVIADGSGLTMAESRRLQLGAAAGRTLGLIARPEWELSQLSAARTRWRVGPARSGTNEPRWVVELLRCKGARLREDARRWLAWWERETGFVHMAADVPDRPGQTAGPPRGPQALSPRWGTPERRIA